MKRYFLVFITFAIVTTSESNSQEKTPSNPNYLGISVSAYILPNPINFSLDALKYNGKTYQGVTLGFTAFLDVIPIDGNAGHLTYTRLAPKSKRIF